MVRVERVGPGTFCIVTDRDTFPELLFSLQIDCPGDRFSRPGGSNRYGDRPSVAAGRSGCADARGRQRDGRQRPADHLQPARGRDLARHARIGGIDDYGEWIGFHGDGSRYQPHEWPLARSLTTGEIVTEEQIDIERFDGSRATITISASPIRDDRGAIVAGVAVVTDVTFKATAAAAREAFVGILAHELRTPITSIFGGAVLLEKAAADPALAEIAADVRAEADRLQRIVDDLVVVSRVEREADLRRTEPLLLQHVIERVVHQELAVRPGASITTHLEPALPTVAGDEGYVEQVLRNLISNALKYGANGPVHVSATLVGDEVVLSVLDSGPGFVDGDEAVVFDLFYRGPAASRRASGSGIGLFVVRSLAQAMGGRAWARTVPTGGAEVSVAFATMTAADVDW